MNAYEYLVLMAERQVVEQVDEEAFCVCSEDGYIVFFFATADGDDWQEGVDYFFLDRYSIRELGDDALYGLFIITPEDVRSILERLDGKFKIDKSLLGF